MNNILIKQRKPEGNRYYESVCSGFQIDNEHVLTLSHCCDGQISVLKNISSTYLKHQVNLLIRDTEIYQRIKCFNSRIEITNSVWSIYVDTYYK